MIRRFDGALTEVIVHIAAFGAVPAIRLSNQRSVGSTNAFLTRLARRSPFRDWRPDALLIARAARRAGRLLDRPDSSCLPRAQFLWLVLASTGREPELIVGAGAEMARGAVAHAWVELDGVPIGEPENVALAHPPFDAPLLRVHRGLGPGARR